MGCLLIIGGILTIAYSYGNSYVIFLGVILLIWGCCSVGNDTGKSGNGNRSRSRNGSRNGNGNGGNNSENGGGYDGPTHTGQGRPTSVTRGDGSTVDTNGYGWQDSVTGGRTNVFTGESVEDNPLGQPEYTDSDGNVDDNATFGYD